MSVSVEEIREMTVAERLQLLDVIWETLSPDDVVLTEAQRRDLDRRVEAHRQNPVSGFTWDEVKARLRR